MLDPKPFLSETTLAARHRALVEPPDVGRHDGVPMDRYLAWGAWSASTARATLGHGPAFARWSRSWSNRSTPATELGTAIHAAILEPHEFETRFAVRETKGSGVRERMASLQAQGITLLGQSTYDLARCARESVLAHPTAGPLIERATSFDRETSLVFDLPDENSGLSLRSKCRIDLLRTDLGIAVDLKSARDVTPREFSRALQTYGYDVTKAHYQAGMAGLDLKVDTYLFLAVENDLPCRVEVYEMGPASTSLGAVRYAAAVSEWAQCVREDRWPEPSTDIRPIELPEWAFDAWSDREHVERAEGVGV